MASSCNCQGSRSGGLAASQERWFLFIDFIVRNISEEEALSFPNTWKVPAILYLEHVDAREQRDYCDLPEQLDHSILSLDASISVLIYSPHGRFTLFIFVHRNRDDNLVQHECLRFEELPKPGALVTIDADFVSMQWEDTEYRSDDTHRVIRPARPSLARVCVSLGTTAQKRASRSLMTTSIRARSSDRFSGINLGDIDLHSSRYRLTPLKLLYTAEC